MKHNYILTTFISFISLFFFFSIIGCKQHSCKDFIFNDQVLFADILPSQVDGASIYIKDLSTGDIIDSTKIVLVMPKKELTSTVLKYPLPHNAIYKFSKPISTNAIWVISLKNSNEIVVSDIKVNKGDRRAMFKRLSFCFIDSFKINGIYQKNKSEESLTIYQNSMQ